MSLSFQADASLATAGGNDVRDVDPKVGLRDGAAAIIPFSPNVDLLAVDLELPVQNASKAHSLMTVSYSQTNV